MYASTPKPQKREKSSEFKNVTKPICVRCNSNNIKKMGFRKTLNRGSNSNGYVSLAKRVLLLTKDFGK